MTAWPRNDDERPAFHAAFCTTADRVHAIELVWLAAMSRVRLYRYRFDASAFRRWAEASGQWISNSIVEPVDVQPVGDPVVRHADAGMELRACEVSPADSRKSRC